ncbi:MAG: 30S ribosomal protein S3 [Candidatus Carbobacillus sp.]|nr:30S ribosomal protein S3 [Candidatus Carbobacillus sp.]
MGQKVSPIGLRVGVIRDWDAKWYAERDFAALLQEDIKIRRYVEEALKDSSLARLEIERAPGRVNVKIHTAKPGMVIGRGGQEIDRLRAELERMSGKKVHIDVIEVKKPDLEAKLVAEWVARQLEARVSFRRAMKQAMQRVMRAGAKGVKVLVSGRLGGAEIARSEGYNEGTVPLHTLRADIDFAIAEAHTTYGVIGVKVWIYRGEVLPKKGKTNAEGMK